MQISIIFTPEQADNLRNLSLLTKSEGVIDVLKKAIAAYDLLVTHQVEGGKIILTDFDGKVENLSLLS